MKIQRLLTIYVVIVISFTPIISSTSAHLDNSNINNIERKWTIIFYDAADFSNGYSPLDDLASQAFSSENVNVVVLQDTYSGPGRIWYIDENHNKVLLEEMGEINMGNYTTLRDFINYCKNNFSAEHYLLFLYGHGGGTWGACPDDTDNDRLRMSEMQDALHESGGVDIICTNACNMAAVESAYELRNCTDVYIASEQICGYYYWLYAMDDLCTLINDKQDMSNIEIGREIINLIKMKRKPVKIFEKILRSGLLKKGLGFQMRITLSAIDTSKMEKVVRAIDQLACDLIPKAENSSFQIRTIRGLAHPLKPNPINIIVTPWIFEVDAYEFSKKCSRFFFLDKDIRTHAKEVMLSIDEAVIANLRGITRSKANGLSLYLPRFKYFYKSNYTALDLDFLDDTHWDEFLKLYFS